MKTSETQPPWADDMERFVVSHDWSNSFSFQFLFFFLKREESMKKTIKQNRWKLTAYTGALTPYFVFIFIMYDIKRKLL